jgi:hypothetical protein
MLFVIENSVINEPTKRWHEEVESEDLAGAVEKMFGKRAEIIDLEGHYQHPNPERGYMISKKRRLPGKDTGTRNVTLGWIWYAEHWYQNHPDN